MSSQEPIGAYQPVQQPPYYGPGGQGSNPNLPQLHQMPSQMQQQMPPQQHVADVLNDQLVQEVQPGSYMDPSMRQKMQPPPSSGSRIPEFLKDPLVVAVLIVLLGNPTIVSWLIKYVPQLGGENGKTTYTSIIVLALLVASVYALVKKFVLTT
jgi:hypothetical protein